jgi:hypothetical protein
LTKVIGWSGRKSSGPIAPTIVAAPVEIKSPFPALCFGLVKGWRNQA